MMLSHLKSQLKESQKVNVKHGRFGRFFKGVNSRKSKISYLKVLWSISTKCSKANAAAVISAVVPGLIVVSSFTEFLVKLN